VTPEAAPDPGVERLLAPFRLLDPSGRRSPLWAWLHQARGDPHFLWSSCPRGDWLAWWLVALQTPPNLVARACCECLRMAEAGLPVCLDAPRRFLVAVLAWVDLQGDLSPCLVASRECALLADDEGLLRPYRSVARSAVWLGRYLHPEPPEGTPTASGDPATVTLALWYAAAAIVGDVNPEEPVGSPWWIRCHEAALGRFAQVIRGCVDPGDIPDFPVLSSLLAPPDQGGYGAARRHPGSGAQAKGRGVDAAKALAKGLPDVSDEGIALGIRGARMGGTPQVRSSPRCRTGCGSRPRGQSRGGRRWR
jgi:hypothetical protein